LDERARRLVLARRARFFAAALAALGSGCTPRATPSAESRTARPTAGRSASGGSQANYATSDQGGESQAPAASGSATSIEPSPPPADADGDGVPDGRDACPSVPGVDAAGSLSAGCPARPCLTIVPPGDVEFHVQFHFASGRSELSAAAGPELDAVVRTLDDHPEIQLEIVGHTDSTEPGQLALARAERVRAALSSRGVSPARLSISAEGDQRPAAENSTAEGRAKNRRVELVRRGPKTPLRSP
jgi:OOP family OmpA-OmpF porin